MNLIGLDISKISTAMVIENNDEYIFSYNNKSIKNKWNKLISKLASVKTYNYNKIEEYSKSEIEKTTVFLKIANDLIKDLKSVIDESEKTIIYIEGYSYGQSLGPIIDLVGIGSIIRGKIIEHIDNVELIKIIAPKSLKLSTAEMVYGFEIKDIGKRKPKIIKEIHRNKNNVKGGDFDKHDMFNAIMEGNFNSELKNLYSINYEDITNIKSYPKPLEDINDAFLLKEMIKYDLKTNKNV